MLEGLPDNAWVIILTHNHQLDYELVESSLKHHNLGFIGMIGSRTKAKRFITKLAHRGFTEKQIATLVSPIGELGVAGKRPIEVAVSISAQLINLLNQDKVKDSGNNLPLMPKFQDKNQYNNVGVTRND